MSTTVESVIRRDARVAWHSDGNLDEIGDYVAADFEYHNPWVSREIRGPDDYRAFVEEFREAFADVAMEIEETIAQGDRVATRFTTRARHVGPIWGLDPTDRDVEITGVIVDHVEDGRIARRYVTDDRFGMLAQLGAIDPDVGAEA